MIQGGLWGIATFCWTNIALEVNSAPVHRSPWHWCSHKAAKMPQIGENCLFEPLESRLLLAAFLLDDVNPKTPQGMNSRVGILGNYVYFGGDDGNFGGKGVWRSDGTEAGTELFAPGA